MSISESWGFQRALSTAQATPIIGPLLFSPVKAVVSVAQLIVGVVGAVFFGLFAAVTLNDTLGGLAAESLGHAGMGLIGLVYSAANIVSLGIVGYRFENLAFKGSLHIK